MSEIWFKFLQHNFSFQQWWITLFQTKPLVKNKRSQTKLTKKLFEGITDPLKQRDLEESNCRKKLKEGDPYICRHCSLCWLERRGRRAQQLSRGFGSFTDMDTQKWAQGATRMKRSPGKHPWLSSVATKGLKSNSSGKPEREQTSQRLDLFKPWMD